MNDNSDFDPLELRRTLGAFATGVTVITTVDGHGGFHGATVNSFNSVSLIPPLILWSLALDTPDFSAFAEAPHFAVNILAEEQIPYSDRFASLDYINKFNGIDTNPGLGGIPLLRDCAAVLECRAEARYPGGDHVILLGRVERIQHFDRRPLIFWGSRYSVLAEPKGEG